MVEGVAAAGVKGSNGGVRPLGTVVVPAYNEVGVVARSLHRLAGALRSDLPEYDWELLVVDDGSTDGTADAADAAGVELRGTEGLTVRVLRHAANAGLGAALQTAFAASRGAVVVTIDCDLSYSPDHVGRLVRALEAERAQMVIASPYMDGGETVAVPGYLERRSRAANRLLSAAAHGTIATMTGMVRAYDGPFLRSLSLKALDVDINVEVIYKTQILRGKIVEMPATLDWSELTRGRSKRTLQMDRRARWNHYHLLVNGFLLRPYMLFLITGMVLFGAGVVIGLVACLVEPGRAAMIPVAVGSAAVGTVLGFLFLISLQAKRYFEELFFLGSRMLRERNGDEAPIGPPPAVGRTVNGSAVHGTKRGRRPLDRTKTHPL